MRGYSVIIASLILCRPFGPAQAWTLPGRAPSGCDPVEIGRGVTQAFLSAPPEGTRSYVHYSTTSEWVNCLQFARSIGDRQLEDSLTAAMEPMYGPKADKLPHMEHVDFSVFGAVPLEIFILNGDRRAYTLGIRYADHQWEAPDMDPATNKNPQMTREQQKALWEKGYSPQTRFWIDDMYMITFLQLQAYRATGAEKYLDRAAKELAAYLERLQKENGLFHHTTNAPFYWGRGNGWVAAGMPMVLKYLPEDSPYYAPILASYRKMMSTLLEFQRKDGLWGQLIDGPDSWSETSCSAMFTYAFIEGWKAGLLDRRYARAARKAWKALCAKLDSKYGLEDVCIGTGGRPDRQWYLDRPRKTGDSHGQAAIMWVVNSLISDSDPSVVYNVRDFGAKGNGRTIDSPAVNAAIARAASNGGGTVVIPEGTYPCYSIRLASGICLKLEKGAVLKAADGLGFDNPEPGPVPQYQDYGHSHFRNSLIWGENLKSVTICGEGLIEGTSLSGGFGDGSVTAGMANKAISLKNCNHVVLDGFTVLRGGHFALLATGVDNLRITGLTVDSVRDGLDIDCCHGVTITSCTVNTPWDDAIVLKASYALGCFRDTEDVTISHCNISGYLDGTLLDGTRVSAEGYDSPFFGAPATDMHGGRIKIGTESSGGFRNISVSDCSLVNSGGLILNAMDGGVIEDVSFRDISMHNVQDCPIFIRLGDRLRSPEGTPVGSIRRVCFRNISARNAYGRWPMMLAGIPGHFIEDISFENVEIEYEGGFASEGAIDPIPERTDAYPDPWLFRNFDNGQNRIHNQYLPFRSLMLRHVRNISFKATGFTFLKQDSRPDYYIEDASGIVGLPQ